MDGVRGGRGVASETDPVWTAVSNTIAAEAAHGQTAYGWGNHADHGYLTDYTETDPRFATSVAARVSGAATGRWETAYGWGNHAAGGYLTGFTETDPHWAAVSTRSSTPTTPG